MKEYPDISELVERKERHRRRLAGLPFEEKMEIVFRLRERREFMRAARAAAEEQGRGGARPSRDDADAEGGANE